MLLILYFLKRCKANLCIRSQIQILISHNFFHTEYCLLKFSGSLELFLKRAIPVRFCSRNLYLATRNFRNVGNFQNLTAMRRKWVTIPPIFGVSQKEPGIRRLYLIQDDPENFSKKYSRRKKVISIFRRGGRTWCFVPPPRYT